jgi:diacylglycerol kinase (ATP)
MKQPLDTGITPSAESLKGQTGMARILKATGYSMAGLKAAFTGEAAFRQLIMLNLILIPVAFYLDVSKAERAILIAVVFLGLIVEILNSAIEATVDRVSLDIHPLAKRAKDMGSGAQFLSLSLIALVWAVILF